MKLNVDAAFDVDLGSGATGAIIRDAAGMFIACCSTTLPSVEDVSTAEALALKNGLALAIEVGCNRILIESDCLEVIEVMESGGNSIGAAAAIYENITFLCRNLSHVLFSHCPREANSAAHTLASKAEGTQFTMWHEEPPDFLLAIIMDDVSVFAK